MERYILALLVVALAACTGAAAGPGLSDTEFITVMTELRRAAVEAGTDTAAFETRRDEILAEHGVTEADLNAFVQSPRRDLHELAAIWDSIGVRLTPGDEVADTVTEVPRREPVLDSARERREPVLDSVRPRRRPGPRTPR